MAVIITALINYHLIFIGCPVDRKLIYDTWNNGIVDVRPVNNARIRYVLDYINKDPVFPDSKYELYGDFEAPFYHYSKGLGFEEIYKLHEEGAFNEFGELQFNDSGRKYILPDYLKKKLDYINKHDMYSDSVKDWSKEKNIFDLDLALINRSQVVETCNTRSMVARGKALIDYKKLQDLESLDRLNRFNGFTDYESIDLQIGLSV